MPRRAARHARRGGLSDIDLLPRACSSTQTACACGAQPCVKMGLLGRYFHGSACRPVPDMTMEAGLRAQELERGAHPVLERAGGHRLAEVDRTPGLAGAKSQLAQARHHVAGLFFANSRTIGFRVVAQAVTQPCGISRVLPRVFTDALSAEGTHREQYEERESRAQSIQARLLVHIQDRLCRRRVEPRLLKR